MRADSKSLEISFQLLLSFYTRSPTYLGLCAPTCSLSNFPRLRFGPSGWLSPK